MRAPWGIAVTGGLYLLVGVLVLTLAVYVGAGVITWDVKGVLLTGRWLALFSSLVGLVGLSFVAAAALMLRRHRRARPAALACWLLAGTLAVGTDRSVKGPGEPLRDYLILTLAPMAVAAALLYAPRSSRMWFSADTSRHS